MTVKLKPKLPDNHGLNTAHKRLLSDQSPIVVVAVLYPESRKDYVDPSKSTEVCVELGGIEVLDGDAASTALDLFTVRHEQRTGTASLPFEGVGP